MSYWNERRTIRKFTPQEVGEDVLDKMLAEASHAPTTGGMQLYSVVVTRKKEILEALYPAHFNQPASTGAPVLLTFCADFNRFTKWCEQRDAQPAYGNFQSFVAAMLDTVIFAQQFVTIAEQNGFGTCYLGTTTYNAPMISEVLHLPRLTVPVITVALGYPADEGAVSDRLSVDAFRHKDVYEDPTQTDIDGFYAEKEALDENKMFVRENAKETLAQVFTDVRYPRANNEHFSNVFLSYLKEQGFLQ